MKKLNYCVCCGEKLDLLLAKKFNETDCSKCKVHLFVKESSDGLDVEAYYYPEYSDLMVKYIES